MTTRNSLRRATHIYLAVIIVVLLPVRAFGWGSKAHQTIALIAMARLSTSAKQAIAKLLDPRETLESVSAEADQTRMLRPETKSWHFVSIPLSDNYYSRTKDCGKGETCLIEAIDQQIAILKDTDRDSNERAEALKFLVNLIGDLHQPFHVTTNTNPQDLAANRVRVISLAGRSTNLHEVWDNDLVEYGLKQSAKSVGDYASTLNSKFSQSSSNQSNRSGGIVSTQGSITDWALEAHKLPWMAYMHNGEFMVADQRSWTLDQGYYDNNLRLVELQLVRAGARLAKVLNDIFNVKQGY